MSNEPKDIISKKTDANTLINEFQELNLKMEHSIFKTQIEKEDTDNIVYSKLKASLDRVETWSPPQKKRVSETTIPDVF